MHRGLSTEAGKWPNSTRGLKPATTYSIEAWRSFLKRGRSIRLRLFSHHQVENPVSNVDLFPDLLPVQVARDRWIFGGNIEHGLFGRFRFHHNRAAQPTIDLNRDSDGICSGVGFIPLRPFLKENRRLMAGALPEFFREVRSKRRNRDQKGFNGFLIRSL